MKKWRTIIVATLVVAIIALFQGAGSTFGAQTKGGAQTAAKTAETAHPGDLKHVPQSEREAAADRKAALKLLLPNDQSLGSKLAQVGALVIGPGSVPDYFGMTPNYANSALPVLAPENNLLARQGTLLKGSTAAVYVTDLIGGVYQRRAISSMAAFNTWGFNVADIYVVPDSELFAYAVGAPVTTGDATRPNGALVKTATNGTVFFLDSGRLRAIASAASFISNGFRWDRIKTITATERSALSVDAPLRTRQGTLLKGSTAAVYVTDLIGGVYQRRAISSMAAFNTWGFNVADIYVVPDSELFAYAVGAPVTTGDAMRPNGALVKTASSAAVSFMDSGQRYRLISAATFNSHGFRWDRIMTITDLEMALYPGGGVVAGTGIRKFLDSLPGLGAANANTLTQTNGFGQYIPVAVPDTATFAGSEYYVIGLVQYTEQMHRDLPATTLRGYVQLVTADTPGAALVGHNPTSLFYPDGVTPIMYEGAPAVAFDPPNYLGPTIVSSKYDPALPVGIGGNGMPSRVKFVNLLPTGMDGDLFLPTDTTVMGAGMGPNMVMAMDAAPVTGLTVSVMTNSPHTFSVGTRVQLTGFTPEAYNGMFMITAVPDTSHFEVTLLTDPLGPATVAGMATEMYTENRATLHLHGGATPWISDGTPHQWITPATEVTNYPQGVSVQSVPDMPDAGPTDGSTTFYYTNQQSARLMFYHDHAYGITRLNVYAGEAAPYVLRDQTEMALVNGGTLPADEIPLVLQDKTFVPDNTTTFTNSLGTFASQLAQQDPTWDTAKWGGPGSLWMPHVYMPNENPADISGMNAMGRWFYGPWFHPPTVGLTYGPIPNPYYDPINAPWEYSVIPGTPDARLISPSMGMESFMDTPVVNGAAYPYLTVEPKAYRFRILNAADDRFFNLQLYKANPAVTTRDGRIQTEVKMVPAEASSNLPADWPTDGRAGGVPDPATKGPDIIQVGNEGGFLPAPVVLPSKPVTWNFDQTNFDFGVVNGGTLILGTAERADVVIDFSQYAGQTLILYNDAPAAFPAIDPRYDYYTGNPDLTDTGGAPSTIAGYGPNTRTVMQIRVAATTPAPAYNIAPLEAAFASTATTDGVFKASQDKVLIPNASYDSAYNALFPTDVYARIQDFSSTFTPLYAAFDAAIAGSGRVGSIAVTGAGNSGGSGYLIAPDVTTIGGGGTGATASSWLSVGPLPGGVTITDPGAGYTSAPTVVFSGGGGSGAAATAVLAGDTVGSVIVTDGGSGYTTMPDVTFTGGGAPTTPAAATASGFVSAVTVTNSGTGYTLPAAVAFTAVGADPGTGAAGTASYDLTINFEPKALQDEMGEAFDKEYGRMSGFLGLEVPRTTATNMNFILYPYPSPAVDNLVDSMTPMSPVAGDGTQIWRITHNGVDTHTIHFHLYNVQLINRVAWDGAIRPPDANELGWKETVRVNPLQDTIVAMRPFVPIMPFAVPNSARLIDPTQPQGVTLSGGPLGFQDPLANPVTITNEMMNFGWEYVYHCHLLSHEEMDMMHAMNIAVAPAGDPSGLTAALGAGGYDLSWTDNSTMETGFKIEWAPTATGPWNYLTTVPAAAGTGTTVLYTDVFTGTRFYRVAAGNMPGSLVATGLPFPGFPAVSAFSGFSNTSP